MTTINRYCPKDVYLFKEAKHCFKNKNIFIRFKQNFLFRSRLKLTDKSGVSPSIRPNIHFPVVPIAEIIIKIPNITQALNNKMI